MSPPPRRTSSRCGSPLSGGGACTRWTTPGAGCGFHDPPPEEHRPLPALVYQCRKPITVYSQDDLEPICCLRCARAVERGDRRRKRGLERQSEAPRPRPAGDPSSGSAPEPLRLEVGNRLLRKVAMAQEVHVTIIDPTDASEV